MTAMKGEEKATAVPWSPTPSEVVWNSEQLVGLIMKLGAFDVDLDRAQPERDAADDLRDGFGVGDDVGVGGVDVEGDSDHDGAVVIGAGEGRGDRDEAQRGALEGAGQVDLAGGVEGVGAGAGGDVGGADLRGGGAAGVGLLDCGRGLGRRRDVGFGAVGDAVQVGGEAGGQGEVQLAEVLVAVFAVELQGEVGEGAGGRVVRCPLRGSG